MKNRIFMAALPALLAASLSMTACQKEKGCKDSSSINYNPDAVVDDGSCEYPYTRFLGTYAVTENYSSSGCGSGSDSYTLIISEGSYYSEIIVTGLGGGMASVKFIVEGNTMQSPYQEAVNSPIGYLDLDEGIGVLSGNTIILNYTVDDILYSNICGYIDASATLTKQ